MDMKTTSSNRNLGVYIDQLKGFSIKRKKTQCVSLKKINIQT
jgi:hypothetical protein